MLLLIESLETTGLMKSKRGKDNFRRGRKHHQLKNDQTFWFLITSGGLAKPPDVSESTRSHGKLTSRGRLMIFCDHLQCRNNARLPRQRHTTLSTSSGGALGRILEQAGCQAWVTLGTEGRSDGSTAGRVGTVRISLIRLIRA